MGDLRARLSGLCRVRAAQATAYVSQLLGGLLVLGGLFLLASAMLTWAQSGEWTAVSTEAALVIAPKGFISWYNEPTSWLGLHQIAIWMSSVPLWLSLISLGILLCFVAIEIDDFDQATY